VSDIVSIQAGPFAFTARLEDARAPETTALFRSMLPYRAHIIQARWSGFAAWVPMGFGNDIQLPPENPTAVPLPGQILLYPGGVSETEILFPYGPTVFASVAGVLAGNHFMTVVSGQDQFDELGHTVQWKGAQEISFD
jgi:hypothetical protein